MAKSIDTAHVRNVGEFYSQHYLDAVLPEDLQATLKRWSEAEAEGGAKTPEKRLAALSEPYFRALAEHQGANGEARRGRIAAGFHARVIEALGYERAPQRVLLPGEVELPVTVAVAQQGRPYLWIVEAALPESEEDADPLGLPPLSVVGDDDDEGEGEADGLPPWRELFDGQVLRQEHAPRWVLLLAGPDAFLVDRDKWPQGQYLGFDLGAMLGQRKPAALRAVAGLLHRDVLLPEGGRSVLDEIDEKSHKHAFAVSTDLKHGVQRAIELIGNEAVWYRREVLKQGVFDKPELARELSRECITYLYRLLFLFYVEARGGEVGVVPMKAEAYRLGLSLESLRDLELVPLSTERAENGHFIHHSLSKLFEVVHLGWPLKRQRDMGAQFADAVDLTVSPQRSPLFDKGRTPILSAVKLRNFVLQEVIALLSLSREGKRGRGKSKQRERISYAQLGINQLGAVYEGLLSYAGFFTPEETFEIRNPKDKGEDAQVYYVGRSKIEGYREDEFRKTKSGKRIVHSKGTFLFRLGGRDREKGASYYTPEVLTQCLTKYTLKERLGEVGKEGALRADEILKLTVCEPAMGSGAFLNEAVSQLAHAYLERKQAELGVQISAEKYQQEWARVKYHFVVHNCYGVDLNPMATELGKVSLWLGVLQPGVQAPYLDLRLRVGNSLIGGRREVYSVEELTRNPNKKTGAVNWLGTPPRRVNPGEKRPKGSVYHFLVPNERMSPYEKDTVVKGLCPEEIEALKKWRTAMKLPFTEMEVRRLQVVCDRIDALWEEHARVRERVLGRVRQPIVVWGQEKPEGDARWKTVEECEGIAREVWRGSSPGARLKAVMDHWCNLWMWPVQKARTLPDRKTWLDWVEGILEKGVGEEEIETQEGRFLHWELEFPEVFRRREGIDVVLGNPPWIKLEWKDSDVLADINPTLALHPEDAQEVVRTASLLPQNRLGNELYLAAHNATTGQQSYLKFCVNYRDLGDSQTNLYKCFFALAWRISEGAHGLFHQPGILDDPRGKGLRRLYLSRVRLVAHFKNELLLFSEVDHQRPYAFTVSSSARAAPDFNLCCNLFHPTTLVGSFSHDGAGAPPSLKTQTGTWNTEPHRARIVRITADELRSFAAIFDPPGTRSNEARVPLLHSRVSVSTINYFGSSARKVADLREHYFPTTGFEEKKSTKAGVLKKENVQPQGPRSLVISGPHVHVGNPLYKTPRGTDSTKHSGRPFIPVDLAVIRRDYWPRSNYTPALTPSKLQKHIPRWRDRPISEYFRFAARKMLPSGGERTLISTIIAPGPTHVDSVFSACFDSTSDLLTVSYFCTSIVADYYIRSLGKANFRNELFRQIPFVESAVGSDRVLRLVCLTDAYSELWNANLAKTSCSSSKDDPRVSGWAKAPGRWTPHSSLRTHYARRQAMVEIDALAALHLSIPLDDLLLIYNSEFSVLRKYESQTFYDRRGKIVFTANRGLPGVGVNPSQWNEIKDAQEGDLLPEWAQDGGGPFVPPFDRCDREADMAEAYDYFKKLPA